MLERDLASGGGEDAARPEELHGYGVGAGFETQRIPFPGESPATRRIEVARGNLAGCPVHREARGKPGLARRIPHGADGDRAEGHDAGRGIHD
jgi:hypothetical protein